jgi:hypothetical protein
MVVDEPGGVRTALRTALTQAMKQREREAVRTYRIALAAIDNAQAVPLTERDRAGAIESAAIGPGAAENPRRILAAGEEAAILRGEAAERRDAARLVRPTDPDRAGILEREADRLEALLDGPAAIG